MRLNNAIALSSPMIVGSDPQHNGRMEQPKWPVDEVRHP
jgi:hypothetical protein